MGAHVRDNLSVTTSHKVAAQQEERFLFQFTDDCSDLLTQTLDAWGRLDGRIHLLLARSGEVLSAETAAHTMDSKCRGIISIRTGYLTINGGNCQQRLDAFLQVQTDQEATMVLECGQGAEHCILRGVALDAKRVCVTIKFVEEIERPALADPEFVFGLTKQEAKVVRELFAGTRMQAIAESLNISIHTVRVHTRHVYEKIGVSSREDLWRVLMPYRL